MTDEVKLDQKLGAFAADFNGKLEVMDSKIEALDVKVEALDVKFTQKLEAMDSKIEALDVKFTEKFETLDAKIDAQTARIALMIENTISKRLDSLFEGVVLNHEKQTDMEERLDTLEARVERLEIQAS